MSDRPCPQGHTTGRYGNGSCRGCVSERNRKRRGSTSTPKPKPVATTPQPQPVVIPQYDVPPRCEHTDSVLGGCRYCMFVEGISRMVEATNSELKDWLWLWNQSPN